jgi:hypothetical protein
MLEAERRLKMTPQNDYILAEDKAEEGLDFIPELMRIMINNSMQVERSKCILAE